MPTNRILGQRIMDAYYQQYRTNRDFFALDDFIFYVGAAFGALAQDEYEKNYQMARSEGDREIMVSFSQDWLSTQVLEVKSAGGRYEAVLDKKIMGFKYDNQNVGIQNVFPIGNTGGGEILRTTIDETWVYEELPTTSRRFWYLDVDTLVFLNIGKCNINKVRINYVPSPDNYEYTIDGSRVKAVWDMSLDMMLRAKTGKPVIPQVNNLNSDKIIQTEADLSQMPIGR